MNIPQAELFTASHTNQGQRIRDLRKKTRLSRRAFAEKYGIPAGTLQNWENERYSGGLTQKAINELIAAFKAEGLDCSVEWLLYGKGHRPFEQSPLVSDDSSEQAIINETRINAEQIQLNEELYQATKAGDCSAVEAFIKKGADLHLYEGIALHQHDNDENTPLHVSAYHGYLDIVKLLIASGSEVNFRNRRKQTPLHLAVLNGHVEVIKYLLDKGADINTVENEGGSPISWAAYTGQSKIVKLLMKIGANVHGKDHVNNSALHWAAYKGHTDIVELLVNSSSADPNEKNSRGETPLDCAVSAGKIETVLFLLKFRKAGNE